MTSEVPQAVDLEEQMRARLMRLGEVFLGRRKETYKPYTEWIGKFPVTEWPDTWGPAMDPLSVEVRGLRESGRYASVRKIPAFSPAGEKIANMVDIVVLPKPASP